MKAFSQTLKDLMRNRGISASAVSKACAIPKSSISEWLSGRKPKMDEALVRLAKFFDVSVEFLITGDHPEETVVSDLVKSLDESFVQIHQGVYRISVEKLKDKKSDFGERKK
ncbi:MAG: helix-turn-helix transcriptional regulator [Bdellovibrionales bacterium]|nr:helix-turn-helix transcriptional regulator [Bdellovibrionales bacterium]